MNDDVVAAAVAVIPPPLPVGRVRERATERERGMRTLRHGIGVGVTVNRWVGSGGTIGERLVAGGIAAATARRHDIGHNVHVGVCHYRDA